MDDADKFRDEIRGLLNDMPMSIVDMNEKQMLACILYKMYEMSKQLKQLDSKVSLLQARRDKK